jgi:hypothetical protein
MKALISTGQEEIKAVISAIPASIDRWVQSLSEKLNMGVSRATT